jgi:hypothetical protein
MAQLNLYVNDELEEKIKKRARHEKKSVSAFVLDLVKGQFQSESWSPGFLKLLDSVPQEEFQLIDEDLPLRPVAAIELRKKNK